LAVTNESTRSGRTKRRAIWLPRHVESCSCCRCARRAANSFRQLSCPDMATLRKSQRSNLKQDASFVAFVQTYRQTDADSLTHTHLYTYIHTRTDTYTYTYPHAHARTHTHTHTTPHTHTQAARWRPLRRTSEAENEQADRQGEVVRTRTHTHTHARTHTYYIQHTPHTWCIASIPLLVLGWMARRVRYEPALLELCVVAGFACLSS